MRVWVWAGLAVLFWVLPAWAQGALCADPAAFCRQPLTDSCLTRFGAGVTVAAGGGAAAEAQACASQRDAYFDCVAQAAERCGGGADAAAGACESAEAQGLYASAERANDCLAYDAFLEACPGSRHALLAEAALKRLSCPEAQAAVAGVDDAPDLGGFRECEGCPEMVALPAGRFQMGAEDASDEEKPAHRVTLGRFAIGRTEITIGEFRRFAEATSHRTGDACWTVDGHGGMTDASGRDWRDPGFSVDDAHPAVCLSWNDAQAYARWLNDRLGRAVYRLPSEAEWEYAARAGATGAYSWGDEPSHDLANYGADDCCGLAEGRDRWLQTAPVGSFPRNGFGLQDMEGNVWEMVQDCWNASYNGAPADGSAWMSGDCAQSVIRGGSWQLSGWGVRPAYRFNGERGGRDATVGFRLARTLTARSR